MKRQHSKRRERYMTVMGTVTLDTWNNCERVPDKAIDVSAPGDYGADPLGEGKFRMIPSGDIVDNEERQRRLSR